MDDDVLARLVATDLRRNLLARAPHVRDVYAFCLWVDDFNGYFLGSFATEAEFERHRRAPHYASKPDEVLRGPGGIRWSVGYWHKFPDDDFVTDETTAALEDLNPSRDDTLDEAATEAQCARFRELAFSVFELARPLDLLPCTSGAIAYVQFAGTTTEEQLEVMARTVPASRLEAAFPGWGWRGQ